PFTLVTAGGPVRIINRHYGIERPQGEIGLNRVRYVGFQPDDPVIVIGDSGNAGVAARRVFGATRAEFKETLDDQKALIPRERVLGGVLGGLGILLLLRWMVKHAAP